MVLYWYCSRNGLALPWVRPCRAIHIRIGPWRQEGKMADMSNSFFADSPVVLPSGGPLYLQLKRWLEDAIHRGAVNPGDALPSERDLATKVDVSRVTVRKAVLQLVKDGVLVQRHG